MDELNNKKGVDLDSFMGLTNDLIEAELRDGQSCNVLMVCKEHYDLWTTKLFPVLKVQRKPCYMPIVKMFHSQGYMNVTERMLQSYFAHIKKSRGEQDANK